MSFNPSTHIQQGPMCPYPEAGCSGCDTPEARRAGAPPATGVDLRKAGQPWTYDGPDQEEWMDGRLYDHELWLDSLDDDPHPHRWTGDDEIVTDDESYGLI